MRTVHLSTLPACDVCKHENGRTVEARFDSPISGGRWGYLCDGHMAERGNTSLASRLSDEPEPERSKADIRRDLMAAIESGDFDLAEDLIGDGDIAEFL